MTTAPASPPSPQSSSLGKVTGYRCTGASAEKQHKLRVVHGTDRIINRPWVLKIGFNLIGDRQKFLCKFTTLVWGKGAGAANLQREKIQRGHHVRKRLGRSHGHFRAGVNVCTPAACAGNGRADHVDHAHDLATLELDFPHSAEGVRGLARLTHRKAEVI